MQENLKKDYLTFIFKRTVNNLWRQNVRHEHITTIRKISERLLRSDNLMKDLYILHHIKEFGNTGKYLIYILKKLEDDVITFDNLTQNANDDAEYLGKELIKYFSAEGEGITDGSNKISFNFDSAEEESEKTEEAMDIEAELKKLDESGSEAGEGEDEEDQELVKFRQNYMELLRTEEEDENAAFELPEKMEMMMGDGVVLPELNSGMYEPEAADPEFDIPSSLVETEKPEAGKPAEISADDTGDKQKNVQPEQEDIPPAESADTAPSSVTSDQPEFNSGGTNSASPIISSIPIPTADLNYDESEESFTIKKTFPGKPETENAEVSNSHEEKSIVNSEEYKLDEDIQNELNIYERELKEKLLDSSIQHSVESGVSADSEEVLSPGETENEEFLNFETEIRSLNGKLNSEFDSLIYIISAKIDNEEERANIISNITNISSDLEYSSKEMSLEIISNIYQAIRLSFEKISNGKYDITESTLNLYKLGLTLVSNLIKGEDYFGYKNILKSIENIRKGLIEENLMREEYIKNKEIKNQLAEKLNEKFSDDLQKEKLVSLKKLIKETDENFKSLYKIEGEFRIYEALRSLTSALTNLKETVLIAKELKLDKLVQLAEAGYVFLKFIQSYRINPVSEDTEKIYRYIIYNMKAIIIDKEVDDQDVFISYLNDPVKIFSNIKKN